MRIPGKYTPLSEKEQDVLTRMIEQQEVYVEVVGWGYHPNPKVTSGDKRVQVRFPMQFVKPVGVEIPVWSFRLRLKDRQGNVLQDTVQSTVYNNQPLYVTAGLEIDLVWDISLEALGEDVIKRVLPGLKGKTVKTIKGG